MLFSFPLFYWLPEVHCEGNTSVSLVLAGLLLKLGVYGLVRFIMSSFFLTIRFLSAFFILLSLIGILIVSNCFFRYYDLKKIISFCSVLHLNLTFVSTLSMNSIGVLCGIITSICHGFSSVGLFLFVGLLISKTYSRFIDSLYYLKSLLRSLFFLLILVTISFPGTFNFLCEILIMIAIVSIDWFFCGCFIVSSFLSTFY